MEKFTAAKVLSHLRSNAGRDNIGKEPESMKYMDCTRPINETDFTLGRVSTTESGR